MATGIEITFPNHPKAKALFKICVDRINAKIPDERRHLIIEELYHNRAVINHAIVRTDLLYYLGRLYERELIKRGFLRNL